MRKKRESLVSNRELSCLVVIGTPEPQVQTNEVYDSFFCL